MRLKLSHIHMQDKTKTPRLHRNMCKSLLNQNIHTFGRYTLTLKAGCNGQEIATLSTYG